MKFRLIVLAILFVHSFQNIAFAQNRAFDDEGGHVGGIVGDDEGGHVGGKVGAGDICRDEINRQRKVLVDILMKDDLKGLDFTNARVEGWNYQSYKNAMLSVLQEGKVIINCYLDPAQVADPFERSMAVRSGIYREITIGIPPERTTCINYEDKNKISHIDCNTNQILSQKMVGDSNYVLTHHEYASIAGVELRTNSIVSDMSISNQLSPFEHWESVKRLGGKLFQGTIDPKSFCEREDTFVEGNFKLIHECKKENASELHPARVTKGDALFEKAFICLRSNGSTYHSVSQRKLIQNTFVSANAPVCDGER